MFSLDFPIATNILLLIALLSAIYVCTVPLRPMRRVKENIPTGYVPSSTSGSIIDSEENQDSGQDKDLKQVTSNLHNDRHAKVSVIVYDSAPEDNLDSYLEAIMQQDYPDFEVILITESTREGTEMLINKYSGMYNHLYITFLPPGSHNLSRRKMAYTIGIKAAKNDIVLTTVTNAFPDSDQWLTKMMEPFNSNKSIGLVLGYSRINFNELKGIRKWYRQFDMVMTDAIWVAYALEGKPYRGEGNNLAFLKRLFFEHKGYASSIFLKYGDDDIFVNELAKTTESTMVLSPEATVTMRWGNLANKIWAEQKSRHNFDARWLPSKPRTVATSFSICLWIMTGCAIAAGITGLPGIIPAIIALLILLTSSIVEIVTYRGAAAKLGAKRLWWSVPLFMLVRPIYNLFFKEIRKELKLNNYIWQRPARHLGQ